LTIKFNDPKEKSVVRTDASNGVSTTTTITWLGWGDGAVSTTGSNYQWSNGGSITRALIASLDTSSSADPDFSIMGTVSSTIIHLTAKFRVQVHTVDQNGNVSDSDNNYTGPETVAIRLVPR
jgi:phage tail sheath gpL-like